MQKNLLVILALVIIIGGGAWYLSGNKQPAMEKSADTVLEGTPVTPDTASPPDAADAKKAAMEITVEGSEFKFSPTTLTMKKGDSVTLTLKNVGKMPHDFVVDELGVRTKVIQGGESDTVTFTPDKSGTFEFYCSVGKHREMGMKGSLIVE